MKIAMIPARMGSQRLKRKNLCLLGGVPLICHAIRKCVEADVFDEIWVNSEHGAFEEIAGQEGVRFHKRPEELADHQATSEDFVYEFLEKHRCGHLYQVHSIAPLLTVGEIRQFVSVMQNSPYDVLLSAVYEQIECACNDIPINFSFDQKTNSQELKPVQRITWSITGWKSQTYLDAHGAGKCATYAGNIGFFKIDRMSGHIIKTIEDLRIAEALLEARGPAGS
jgi:CMP-N-acetylneuraminic acid synthetase